MNTKRGLNLVRKIACAAAALALAGAALAAHAQAAAANRQSVSESQIQAVSQVPVRRVPMTEQAKPLLAQPRVASKGNCAPVYAGGGRGSCINDKPCRGFGVREADGSAACMCYAQKGGCGAGERCDNQRLRCVSEKESRFGRAADD